MNLTDNFNSHCNENSKINKTFQIKYDRTSNNIVEILKKNDRVKAGNKKVISKMFYLLSSSSESEPDEDDCPELEDDDFLDFTLSLSDSPELKTSEH